MNTITVKTLDDINEMIRTYIDEDCVRVKIHGITEPIEVHEIPTMGDDSDLPHKLYTIGNTISLQDAEVHSPDEFMDAVLCGHDLIELNDASSICCCLAEIHHILDEQKTYMDISDYEPEHAELIDLRGA